MPATTTTRFDVSRAARPSLLAGLRRLLGLERPARTPALADALRHVPPVDVDTSDDTSLTQASLEVLK